MNQKFGCLIIVVAVALFAGDLSFSKNNKKNKAKSSHSLASFKKGSGSEYVLKLKGEAQAGKVVLYVTEQKGNKLAIEMAFSGAPAGFPVKLWQQFHLEAAPKPIIKKSFIKIPQMPKPEEFSIEKVTQQTGVPLGDFILRSEDELKKHFVNVESVSTPAGMIKAKHYKMARKGGTVDFWISDKAKPFGLVKLKGTGKVAYELALESLVVGVKPKINPSEAVPLTSLGKTILNIALPFQ